MLPLLSPTAKPAAFAAVIIPRRKFRLASLTPCAAVAEASATMYDLLSVAETAAPEEIKAAFRLQARRWHPDACRQAGEESLFSERFRQAREAYEVLSDPNLRREYDRLLLFSDGWTTAGGSGAVILRRDREHHSGFGDWEDQLDGLSRRREPRWAVNSARRRRRRAAGGEGDSWGSRARRAHAVDASE
ncbi:chaperone protein DnaJ-like [Zingiber officinale]|uniref:J domain-containing protein n=1 Tax=Zingiber officinale TaxID=94328 RepID=A0A8J5BSC7_ZINOF|nr:chaperone protein DnaJ-like [Zingiber officinale]KAG6466202.1 hypothetical protein ZIOFF_075986 [Zingiber officinale]